MAPAPCLPLPPASLPLLHPGGRLLALKGERADSELASSGAALKAAGAAGACVVQVGSEPHQAELVVSRRHTRQLRDLLVREPLRGEQ